jgi:hypothetical protein
MGVAATGAGAALWRSRRMMLAEWGAFNLVEGLIGHQLLGIHHVCADLGGPLGWDVAFLGLGILLVRRGPGARSRRPEPHRAAGEATAEVRRGAEIDDVKDADNMLAVFLRGPGACASSRSSTSQAFALV